jgi:hypothetical protein
MKFEVLYMFNTTPIIVDNVSSWKVDEDTGVLSFEDDDDGTLAAFNQWVYFRAILTAN